MRIAITNHDGRISPVFDVARRLVLVDVEQGREAVITGNIGPRAFTALEAGRVDVYMGAKGPVAEAIEEFKAGTLQEAKQANVEGHWA